MPKKNPKIFVKGRLIKKADDLFTKKDIKAIVNDILENRKTQYITRRWRG